MVKGPHKNKLIVNPSFHILQDQFATRKHIGSLPSWEDNWLQGVLHAKNRHRLRSNTSSHPIPKRSYELSLIPLFIQATCYRFICPSISIIWSYLILCADLFEMGQASRGSLQPVWLQSPPCQSKRKVQSSYCMFLWHCGQSLRHKGDWTVNIGRHCILTKFDAGFKLTGLLEEALQWPHPGHNEKTQTAPLAPLARDGTGLPAREYQYQAIVAEKQIACWILLVHFENCLPFTGILLNKRKKQLNKHHLEWRGDNNMAAGSLLR